MSDGPITERGDPRDRISNQRELFDVATTQPTRCPHCHTVRDAGEQKAPGCDYDRARFLERDRKRPKGCLNAYDPTADPFPEGY